jgi:aspartate/methionine/tyrosine aminotransferase
MHDGRIPLDLAVCRWLAMEKKVVAMPNSFFYQPTSKNLQDNFIRLAICKGEQHTRNAVQRIRK